MKSSTSLACCLILNIVLLTCAKDRPATTDRPCLRPELRALLDSLGDNTSATYYLIIPLAGCPPCVQEGLHLLRARLDNPKVTFIITSNEAKRITLTLTQKELQAKNVLIDRDNVLDKAGVVDDGLVRIYATETCLYETRLYSDSIHFLLDDIYKYTI